MRATLFLVLLPTLALAQKPKLVVFELTPGGGADPKVVGAFTQALSDAVSRCGYFDVMSTADVVALLGVERQRQLSGCSDASACTAELSDALGARFVMTGTLVKLGEVWQLTLTTLDTQKSQPLGRSTRIAAELASLQAQLPWSVADATATSAPPVPSKVLPVSLVSVGGAAIAVGGVLGIQALNQEATIRGELNSTTIDLRQRYQQEAQAATMLKSISLVTMVAGAAVMGLGVWRFSATSQSLVTVAAIPTGTGVAFAGSFQ